MIEESQSDLSAQIRALFPGESAAVSADEAMAMVSISSSVSPRRRRFLGRGNLPHRIGLRSAIVWGVAVAIIFVGIGFGLGTSRTSSLPTSPSKHGKKPPPPTRRATIPSTTPTSVQSPPTRQFASPLPVGSDVAYEDLQSISFVSDEVGFGVVYNSNYEPLSRAAFVTTVNGGETWTVKGTLPNFPGGEVQVVFSNLSHGFLWSTESKTIELTDDGGAHWSAFSLKAPAAQVAQRGQSVMIIEDRCDQFCSGIWAAWSSDGGSSWSQSAISDTTPPSSATSLMENSAGVIASATNAYVIVYGYVYVTYDSGSSWQALSEEPCLQNIYTVEIAVITSPTLTVFVACGGEPGAGNEGKAFYASSDGRTWTLRSAVGWGQQSTSVGSFLGSSTYGYVDSIQAVSSTTVYMLLARFGVIVTTDGGRDWNVTSMGAADGGGGFGTMQFVDPSHGWADFRGEGLWGTVNGSLWIPLDATPRS